MHVRYLVTNQLVWLDTVERGDYYVVNLMKYSALRH